MFDIDSLAKQVLCEEELIPESYSSIDEVYELRNTDKEVKNSNLENSNYNDIIKNLSKYPDRIYRIGEVSEIIGLKDTVLRYWETKFPKILKPKKNSGGQRVYKLKDIINFFRIKKLLMVDKLTIEGVNKNFNNNQNEMNAISDNVLKIIKDELEDLIMITNTHIEELSRLNSG